MFSTSEIVTVAICSPHPIIRAGLREILRREDPFHVLDAPLPIERTTAWIREAKPNVVIYDVRSAAETMALLQALKEVLYV